MTDFELEKLDDNIYEIPQDDEMNAPARVYASEELLDEIKQDKTLQQVRNVATMPGIVEHSIVLPDGHQGYGFPIGGVAAFDADDGIISPGGIGYDINCGVRLLQTNLKYDDIRGKEETVVNALYDAVPCGLGKGGYLDIDKDDLCGILEGGVEWMVENGHARKEDLRRCEENGCLPGDASKVPEEALDRGVNQVGSLGSGNHFLEVQRVADVFDDSAAEAFGLREDGVVVMVHSGSRGLGHQTCTEYLRRFEKTYPERTDKLVDRELVHAPIADEVAQDYRDAMYAAANFAWANRQAMTQAVRHTLDRVFGGVETRLVYDVCHNVAKEETHTIDGENRDLLVHRKGATRAFPAGREEVPDVYAEVGQPVLIPGSMGAGSYVLKGGEESLERSFGSTAHGAGRLMSRTQAKQDFWGGDVQDELREEDVYVKAESGATIAEEAPGVYKDIDEVIRVSDELGIGQKVARTRPIANIKG